MLAMNIDLGPEETRQLLRAADLDKSGSLDFGVRSPAARSRSAGR
jgi:hypothetical protein